MIFKRVGDYCGIHNPEDPKFALHIIKTGARKGEKCGEKLSSQRSAIITAQTKNPEGLFDKILY